MSAIPSKVDNDAEEILKDVPVCVRRAVVTHGHLGGILESFPGLPLDTWFWHAQDEYFYPVTEGTYWFPAGENPFASPCN